MARFAAQRDNLIPTWNPVAFGYMYITVNTINNKKYIGRHTSKKFNPWYKGSGVLLKKAINKYGKSKFLTHILDWCCSVDSLKNREIYWIKKFEANLRSDFYNLSEGGENAAGMVMSPVLKEKLLKINTGRSLSVGHKKKLSEALKERWRDPEFRNKVTVSLQKGTKRAYLNGNIPPSRKGVIRVIKRRFNKNARDSYTQWPTRKKLTPTDVREIRASYIPGDKIYGQKPMACKYKVGPSTIKQIINYITWKGLL